MLVKEGFINVTYGLVINHSTRKYWKIRGNLTHRKSGRDDGGDRILWRFSKRGNEVEVPQWDSDLSFFFYLCMRKN